MQVGKPPSAFSVQMPLRTGLSHELCSFPCALVRFPGWNKLKAEFKKISSQAQREKEP